MPGSLRKNPESGNDQQSVSGMHFTETSRQKIVSIEYDDLNYETGEA